MNHSESPNTMSPMKIIVLIAAFVITAVVMWFVMPEKKNEPEISQPIETPIVVAEPIVEESDIIEEIQPIPEQPVVEELPIVEPEPVLPLLSESDEWIQEKLPELTWRKELLKLVIDDDMVRRFVVFVDNFSQGIVAYEHSPLVLPKTKFSATEGTSTNNQPAEWQWNKDTEKRFNLYVELLRSLDVESLVQLYGEFKPLVNQAYEELGYPDEDFTETLQASISRVLDMEFPKESPELVRPSVMYQYADSDIEALDDADKLLLRIGKENLLVVKSVLLEINEKLARQQY